MRRLESTEGGRYLISAASRGWATAVLCGCLVLASLLLCQAAFAKEPNEPTGLYFGAPKTNVTGTGDTTPGGASIDEEAIDKKFWESIRQAQVIYISEMHDDESHHDYEFALLQAMHQKRMDFSVGWEIFDVSQQPLVDQWQHGRISLFVLLQKLRWDETWGQYSSSYRQMLEWTHENKIESVALNAPYEFIRTLETGRLFSDSDRSWFPQGFQPLIGGFEHYAEQMADRPEFERMPQDEIAARFRVQTIWDQVIAANIVQFLKMHPTEKLVVILGRAHAEGAFGVPAFVQQKMSVRQLVLYPSEVLGDQTVPRFAENCHILQFEDIN